MARTYARHIWRRPPSDTLMPKIEGMWTSLDDNVDREVHALSSQVLSFMRTNHPWRNQSGDAEAELFVEKIPGGFRFGHGVFYGVFLEFKNGGQWGVMRLTLAYTASQMPAVMARSLQRTMEG